jgi:hypothetical protein
MECFETAGSADRISGGKEYTPLAGTGGEFGGVRACATLKMPA